MTFRRSRNIFFKRYASFSISLDWSI